MKSFVKRVVYGRNLYFLLLSLRVFLGRHFFLAVSICCFAGYLWLMQGFLQKLQRIMAEKAELYVERIEQGPANAMHDPVAAAMIEAIIENNDLPVIVTDAAGVPIAWTQILRENLLSGRAIASSDTSHAGRRQVQAVAAGLLKTSARCWTIHTARGSTAGYLVTGTSTAIRNISIFSFVMAIFFVGFVVFLSLNFHAMRINERTNLWVALAKETAHQLGTPITALMGWVEYLRSTRDSDSSVTPAEVVGQIEKICGDMEDDLKRLRKISSRFSQIGSVPDLEPCNINEILIDCMHYFKVRLPLLRRRIEIRQQFGEVPQVRASRELIEWVFENLIKNSIDAIRRESGRIEIRTEFVRDERMVRVYHADNGSGITWEAHKKIFSAGYTTKKRGWGLGLTLAKRIIEDYHQGKIFVQWSKKDKGTVICVELPVHVQG